MVKATQFSFGGTAAVVASMALILGLSAAILAISRTLGAWIPAHLP